MSSNSSSMEEIQALNMVGVDLLVQGDLKEAASVFSYCLAQLSWCIISPTPLAPTETSSSASASSCSLISSNIDNCQDQGGGTSCSSSCKQEGVTTVPVRPTVNRKDNSTCPPPIPALSLGSYYATATDLDLEEDSDEDDDADASKEDDGIVIDVKPKFAIHSLDETAGHAIFDPRKDFYYHPYCFECGDPSLYHQKQLDQQRQQGADVTAMQWSYTDWPPSSLPTEAQHLAMNICCLYNLALCHQLDWQLNNKLNTRLLRIAQEYYKQAFTLAQSYQGHFIFEMTDPVVNVLMAICVNSTHCHVQLVNLPEVRVWNSYLCRLLACTQRRELYPDESVESPTIHSFFALNAFLNNIPRNTAYAA